jgi:PKD repeat protein
VPQAGTHDVSVTASNSAGDDVQNFQVTVMILPKFRTFPTQFDAVVDSLFTYTFSADGYPAPTFVLLGHPDGMTMDSLGVLCWTPTASQTGSTTVTIETINRAGSQTLPFTITVSPVAGIDDPGTLPACALLPGYPNPVSITRNTVFSLPMDITRPVSVNGIISDAAGRRIRSLHLEVNTPGLRTVQIPVDGMLPGMYMVMLNAGNKRLVQSFVVVK